MHAKFTKGLLCVILSMLATIISFGQTGIPVRKYNPKFNHSNTPASFKKVEAMKVVCTCKVQ